MKSFNKDIGNYGEYISKTFLIKKGYKILCTNFRYKHGEIDIICTLKDLIIFCEIKSRYTNSFGSPMESVTCYKQKQIIKLSQMYIMLNNISNYNIRYDVIEVSFNSLNTSYIVNHIKDAFRTY